MIKKAIPYFLIFFLILFSLFQFIKIKELKEEVENVQSDIYHNDKELHRLKKHSDDLEYQINQTKNSTEDNESRIDDLENRRISISVSRQ